MAVTVPLVNFLKTVNLRKVALPGRRRLTLASALVSLSIILTSYSLACTICSYYHLPGCLWVSNGALLAVYLLQRQPVNNAVDLLP